MKAARGPEFYEQIGKKGAARLKELIAAGKASLESSQASAEYDGGQKQGPSEC